MENQKNVKMHRTAERLQAIYGSEIDVAGLWEQLIAKRQFFSINSEFFRVEFLDKIYTAALALKGVNTSTLKDEEPCIPESRFTCPITDNVPSSQYSNLMHVCHKCLRNGRTEEQARNIRADYSFFSGDESGVEKLKCMTCGNSWTR